MFRDTATLGVSRCGFDPQELGIELATFRLPANPLYRLSHMAPIMELLKQFTYLWMLSELLLERSD